MKTIRRFYFYLITLISMQVVIWAVVNLLRTIFDSGVVSSVVDWLAGGIAFVLVGVPIFWLHWTTVQRDAQKDGEEGTSQLRALFLYATPLATGIPITYAILAILNRLIAQALGLSVSEAMLGGGQTHIDNLIAIVANLVILVYFWRVLQQDWRTVSSQDHLTDTRRLYRNIWMIYGLGLIVIGAQQILRFIFFTPQEFGNFSVSWLATGLTLLLVGLPIWFRFWKIIQISLTDDHEKKSTLRLIVLYALTFLGIGFTITAIGILLTDGFRWIFQVESWKVRSFIDQQTAALSLLLTMGFVWLYFRRELQLAISENGDELRQASLRRVYNSILSFAGLVVSFIGLLYLLGAIIENLFNLSLGSQAAMLSDALALLVIGLPLWLYYWLIIQHEVRQNNQIAISARKSVIRRVYLYLALFATVVGGMISTGWWIYGILDALLDQIPANFWLNFFLQFRIAGLFVVFLIYHLRVLRTDGKETDDALKKEVASFSVLILQNEESNLGNEIIKAFQQESANVSVTLADLDQLSKDKPDLLVISANLTANPPVPLREYLNDYSGKVLVLPERSENWYWLNTLQPAQNKLVRDAVKAIEQFSENQTPPTASTSPWLVVVYILAGLFTLEVIFILLAALVNIFSI